MDWSVIKCTKCNEPAEKDEEHYMCDACKNAVHKKCANLTSTEIRCLQLQKRNLKFMCDSCTNFMSKLPMMLHLIEDLKKDVEQMKGSLVNQCNENAQSRKYSDVIKSKPDPVLVVKPIKEQQSKETRSEIRKAIDPVDIGIAVSQIRQVSKGGIVIGCEKTEDRNILKAKMNEKLGEKYNIAIPSLKKPKLKIVNINNDDISESEDKIVDTIIKQNKIDSSEKQFHLKLLKVIQNKTRRSSTLILEVDPTTYSSILRNEKITIGWSRGRVYDHVNMVQCFKCYRFNHIAKDCQKNTICSLCSGSHNYTTCTSNQKKCSNCSWARTKLNIELDTNHGATDKKCPCYQRLLAKLTSKVDYSTD